MLKSMLIRQKIGRKWVFQKGTKDKQSKNMFPKIQFFAYRAALNNIVK